MTPEQLVLLQGLEHQLVQLRRVRDRLRATDRVNPGQPIEWTGSARRAYELAVVGLTDALDRADTALETAVGATATSIGTLRRG